jgi:hypothetical protein
LEYFNRFKKYLKIGDFMKNISKNKFIILTALLASGQAYASLGGLQAMIGDAKSKPVLSEPTVQGGLPSAILGGLGVVIDDIIGEKASPKKSMLEHFVVAHTIMSWSLTTATCSLLSTECVPGMASMIGGLLYLDPKKTKTQANAGLALMAVPHAVNLYHVYKKMSTAPAVAPDIA